jgi:hypothetical protein
MPVARYFVFMGGVLLTLLFMIDAYLPKEPVLSSAVESAPAANPALRIRSDRKWPERVVYDTSVPTVVPPEATKTAAASAAPVTQMSDKAQLRESFAQLATPGPSKPEPQVLPKPKRRIAKTRTTPPMTIAAQRPNFGFFGNNTW